MNSFLLITTGGTIDKVYDPIAGSLGFGKSSIPDRLERLAMGRVWEHRPLMSIDSLDMQQTHRVEIAQACRETSEEQILITHGTDTMVETAEEIATGLPEGRMVVLTGAMIPLSVRGSDGDFHLGSALAHLQRRKEGVFISMHGELFSWDACRKDRKQGKFVSIS